VAIIMDGNGRWASERGEARLVGHKEGAESVRSVTRYARKMGLKALTLYAFSSQNWDRPSEEVAGLMQLLHDYLVSERDELLDNDVRLDAVGELDRLPEFVRTPLEALRKETAGCQAMVLTLCLSYGGQEELLTAFRDLGAKLLSGAIQLSDFGLEALRASLWTGHLPEPDLIVRTSGEQRLSNFLLFGAAYAELYFTALTWPEFREEALLAAVLDFQARQRRFGLTAEQAGGDLR